MKDDINDVGFNAADFMGKIGERHYIKKLQRLKERGKIKGYLDLRENLLCRLVDIDVAVFTKDKVYTEEEVEKMILTRKHVDDCCLIDVKTDAVTLSSNNFFLEWTAHLRPGCFGSTHADKWVYYAIDKGEKEIRQLDEPDLKRVWLINIPGLRNLIVSRSEMELKRNGKPVYRPHYCKEETKENFGHLVNIDYLTERGIAKELNII